ncbi:MAG: glycosyltransferase [Verrucomicrobiales bacterium]|nr:glycosyltransferase [Verrucomicrobiales bacterium]
MKISVVIPAFNEERLLGQSLAQIKTAANAFTQRGWEVELIVCNNNSTDRTAEIARAAGAIVVFEPVNQIGRARNCGALAATGGWLIFVDADSHPSAGLFADVAEQIVSGQCLAGGATIRIDTRDRTARTVTWAWNCASRMRRLLAGSFIFCDTAVFRKIGGFSDRLFVAEELELTQRLRRHAKETGKRIVILHRHPLVTSARKMHLYTKLEHLRFLASVIFSNGRALTSRDAAHLWYDGRR